MDQHQHQVVTIVLEFTYAVDSISFKAFFASAVETSNDVSAVSILMTIIEGGVGTLIHIYR